jgi:hypothetical protein
MNGSGSMSYDVIGDIHGHVEPLVALLLRLGYVPWGRGFRAPAGRQAVFLGDLIDRGPGQTRVLEIVRAMVDSGDARCILGNHEFNAISFVTPALDGSDCLRPNRANPGKCAKNRAQHAAFLAAVGEGSAGHRACIDWFRSLPLFLDLGGIRVVHASWHAPSAAVVAEQYWDCQGRMSDEFLYGAHEAGSALAAARKRLTCGLELALPEGAFITDKDGHRHFDFRVACWRDWARNLRQVALVPAGFEEQVPDAPIGASVLNPIKGAPVFLGHHWFNGPHPAIESPKVAVLDWSVAKGGRLVAYRWDGEQRLSNDKLAWVN